MEWVNKIGNFFLKSLAFLPCFFTITNYFTVLTVEQRTSKMGIIFLLAGILYFLVCFYFLINNWKS
jgi:hypothetical protein